LLILLTTGDAYGHVIVQRSAQNFIVWTTWCLIDKWSSIDRQRFNINPRRLTMPTTITTVSPFYDNGSIAPPPFSSLLTDQLELFGSGRGQHSSSLLADEVLPSATRITAPPKVTRSQTQKSAALTPEFKLAVRSPKSHACATSPYPKKPPKQPCAGFHNHPSSDLSSDSDSSVESSGLSSDDKSTSDTLSEDFKIPKPPGESGRPGRGGYNLETTLDWNHKMYAKFKVS
jgi:hypothetical protein